MLSVRGLVRAIFEEQWQIMKRARSCDESTADPVYVPKTFDGEYNVVFGHKPLGVGLVPSSQLYGSWEVSSMQDVVHHHESHLQDKDNKTEPAKGDVLIAVNLSCRKAHLPRAQLAAYLRQCSCPIVLTLRKPEVYGCLDSQAMSTAMYPASMDYDLTCYATKVVARASSLQWQRSLEHDLALNAVAAKSEKSRLRAQALVSKDKVDYLMAPLTEKVKFVAALESDNTASRLKEKMVTGLLLSEVGEFDVTFDELPLQLALAPSTRMYGSVEVAHPKHHAPIIQVGDVVMAVNGDASMSRLSSDEVSDAIAELQAPITLRFRRPVVYRKYLTAFFDTTRKMLSSESIASAMFPLTAEYKRRALKHAPKQVFQAQTLVTHSFIEPDTASMLPKSADTRDTERFKELRRFSAKIGTLDQFKLWAGGKGFHDRNPLAGHQSAFLTEKHVQFLRKNLPHHLTCTQMELVYSTHKHGWNVLSFFDQLQDKGPTILCVQDDNDNVFGAFCPASWKRSKTIFGNGRTFVFSLSSRMNTYTWSGINSSFMYTQHDAIFIGGGNTGIALCLQLDDRRGFTHACTTFDSPPLVDYQSFCCDTVEVWGFYGIKL